MFKVEDGIIPMDDAINEFEQHLYNHPRTILSARFGDGKSFFLAAAEKALKEHFTFIKVYPVNYQVDDNQSIFEYIKRDILFQLYGSGLISESYEIPDEIAAYFFLQNNWESFAKEILNTLSMFEASNTIKVSLGAAKFLKSIKKKYDGFKKNGGEIGNRLDRFISSFDDKGIYEADPITSVLCDIIKHWQDANPDKKLCLIFEDMDRIDPQHIFRILNVISAHMDYGYKYGVSPKNWNLVGNKFGVDNIIVCLDYDNLKHIFHHFYGPKACFEGYINKFSDKGIFRYSLHKVAENNYVNQLIRVTEMDKSAILAVLNNLNISNFTIRQFYKSIDGVENQIYLPESRDNIIPHKGLYILAAVLQRLGLNSDDIDDLLTRSFHAYPIEIGTYAASSLLLHDDNKSTFSFLDKNDDDYIEVYNIKKILPDGRAVLESDTMSSEWPFLNCSPEEVIKDILKSVYR